MTLQASEVPNFVLQALAVSAFSITMTRAKVTEPLRERTRGKLRDLFRCPYCISHYAAFGISLVYLPPIPGLTEVFETLVYAYGLVGLSALFIGGVFRLLMWSEVKIQDLHEALDVSQKALDELTEATEER